MIPFRAVLRSEWTKLASLRSTKVMAALVLVLAVGMSALLAVISGATFDKWSAGERAAFEPISAAMFGSLFSTIVFAVLGVMTGTSEYGSGTMRLTLAATPRRWRVLAAKAIVLAALALVVGLAADVAMFLVAQAVHASYGLRTASLADGDALRAVLCDGLLAPLLPLMALSLGIALRSTAGALTSILAFVFAPWIVGGLLPDWWQDNILGNLPGAAAEAITMGHLPVSESDMAPGLASIVVAAWLAVFLGAACVALERRDA